MLQKPLPQTYFKPTIPLKQKYTSGILLPKIIRAPPVEKQEIVYATPVLDQSTVRSLLSNPLQTESYYPEKPHHVNLQQEFQVLIPVHLKSTDTIPITSFKIKPNMSSIINQDLDPVNLVFTHRILTTNDYYLANLTTPTFEAYRPHSEPRKIQKQRIERRVRTVPSTSHDFDCLGGNLGPIKPISTFNSRCTTALLKTDTKPSISVFKDTLTPCYNVISGDERPFTTSTIPRIKKKVMDTRPQTTSDEVSILIETLDHGISHEIHSRTTSHSHYRIPSQEVFEKTNEIESELIEPEIKSLDDRIELAAFQHLFTDSVPLKHAFINTQEIEIHGMNWLSNNTKKNLQEWEKEQLNVLSFSSSEPVREKYVQKRTDSRMFNNCKKKKVDEKLPVGLDPLKEEPEESYEKHTDSSAQNSDVPDLFNIRRVSIFSRSDRFSKRNSVAEDSRAQTASSETRDEFEVMKSRRTSRLGSIPSNPPISYNRRDSNALSSRRHSIADKQPEQQENENEAEGENETIEVHENRVSTTSRYSESQRASISDGTKLCSNSVDVAPIENHHQDSEQFATNQSLNVFKKVSPRKFSVQKKTKTRKDKNKGEKIVELRPEQRSALVNATGSCIQIINIHAIKIQRYIFNSFRFVRFFQGIRKFTIIRDAVRLIQRIFRTYRCSKEYNKIKELRKLKKNTLNAKKNLIKNSVQAMIHGNGEYLGKSLYQDSRNCVLDRFRQYLIDKSQNKCENEGIVHGNWKIIQEFQARDDFTDLAEKKTSIIENANKCSDLLVIVEANDKLELSDDMQTALEIKVLLITFMTSNFNPKSLAQALEAWKRFIV